MTRPGLGWRTIIGVGEEVTWASGGAVDSYFPITSESLVAEEEPVQGNGLYSSAARNKWSRGTVDVNGDIEFELQPEGFGKILKHALGFGKSTSLGSGVYRHTIRPSGMLPSGLRIEVDRDKKIFTYYGCKIDSLELTGAVDEHVVGTASFLGKTEKQSDNRTLANPTISTLDPFVFHEGAVLVGNAAVEITGFTLTLNNNLQDDHYTNVSRLRRSIERQDFREVTGTLTMVFESITAYEYFRTMTPKTIRLTFTSDALPGGYNYELQIDVPEAVFTGTTPTVDGPGPITHDMNFTAFFDDEGSYQQKDEMRITLTNNQSSL